MNQDDNGASAGITSSTQEPQHEPDALNLEAWVDTASSRFRRATLPWVIALSPVKAFSRRCRLEKALTVSPFRVFLWTLVWYVVLLVVAAGIRCGVDKLQGVQLTIGSYWNHPFAARFGAVGLLPVHIPLAWLQCLLVTIIGIVVAFRPLTVRQITRLTTWLFTFTLVAGSLHLLYGLLWSEVLDMLLLRLPDVLALTAHTAGFEVMFRAHDIALGLLGGVAVGTVLQKRRWLVTLVSAVALTILFPVYTHLQHAYAQSVHHPLRRLIVAEPDLPVRITLLPECLKVPGYEEHIWSAFSRSTEDALSRGDLPTSHAGYVVEPMLDGETLLHAIRTHLGSLGWMPLRHDPLNVHVDMPTGDAAGWRVGDPGVTAPPGDGRQWGGWWVREGEAVNVFLWHGTPPEQTFKSASCSMSHYSKEVADRLLHAYREVHGDLPGEAPTNAEEPGNKADTGG